jgi:hypothetical protein
MDVNDVIGKVNGQSLKITTMEQAQELKVRYDFTITSRLHTSYMLRGSEKASTYMDIRAFDC